MIYYIVKCIVSLIFYYSILGDIETYIHDKREVNNIMLKIFMMMILYSVM